MRNKKTRAAVVQWLVPSIVLLFIVITMLIDFSVTSRRKIEENLEKNITDVADDYADELYKDLSAMTLSGAPIASAVGLSDYNNEKDIIQLISRLKENTVIYAAVYSDNEGKGYDYNGRKVDMSKEPYFTQISKTTQSYTYVKEDFLYKRSAIVSSIPVMSDKEIKGVLLLYYPVERFSKMLKRIEFDSLSFYLVVDEAGNRIITAGATSSYLEEINILELLAKAEISNSSYEKMKYKFTKMTKGIAKASYKGEERAIVYVPMPVNNWHMVLGINKSYLDKQENLQLTETTDVIWKVLAALAVFFGLVIIINVVNKIRFNEQSKNLETKADTDLLTELNNKIATERKIKEYIEDYPNRQSMMFVLDIDNFKKINDTMGHAFGDEVLRTLGLRIRAEFRVSDILGRVGGDEFIIFLKDIPDDDLVLKEAEKVAKFFRNFQAGEYVKYSATASIGTVVFPKDGTSFESLYKAADKALYKAKKRGKNQLAFYDSSYDIRRGIVDEEQQNSQND